MFNLHIGCGGNVLKDWINVDISPYVKDVFYLDARERLPYSDDSVDLIFHEHLIEHFTFEEAVDFTSECYRVLKPGGVMRVGTTDLEQLICMRTQRYLNTYIEDFLSKTSSTDHGPSKYCSMLNRYFHDWGHKFLYDPATLRFLLETKAFEVRHSVHQVGHYSKELNSIDGHWKVLGRNEVEMTSMYMEGRKL